MGKKVNHHILHTFVSYLINSLLFQSQIINTSQLLNKQQIPNIATHTGFPFFAIWNVVVFLVVSDVICNQCFCVYVYAYLYTVSAGTHIFIRLGRTQVVQN